jgi:hypothetical protein
MWNIVYSRKSFYIFSFQIYSKWVHGLIKAEKVFFETKLSLCFISFTTIYANWPNLVPDFIKTLKSMV